MPPEHVVKAQTKALEVNRAHQNGGPIQAPTTPQTSLPQLLNDPNATWEFSASGGGGASIVRSTSATGGGAAVKIQHDEQIKNAERSAKILEEFFKHANGPAPFAAPRVRIYKRDFFTQNAGLKDELDHRLDAEKDPTMWKPQRVDHQKENLGSIITKDDHAVFVMEFGNGKPLSSLPTEEKAGLIRSGAFAESMGRTFAPCMVLGLRDHLGDPFNPSNVLYDTASGTLSVIDYDAGGRRQKNGHQLIGIVNDNVNKMAQLRKFLEDATRSPEDFQKAIDNLMDPEPRNPTPLHEAFHCMFQKGSELGEAFFTRDDDPTSHADISINEKRDFAAHFIKGAIDGVGYMQSNRQALKDAVLSTHEDMPDGTKLEHFYDQAKLDQLDHEIGQFDIAKLQNDMNQVMQHREQHLGEEHDTLVANQQRVKELNLQIDRRMKRPTAWEKIKDFFGRSKAVERMKAERDPLARQLHLGNQNRDEQRGSAVLDDKADWLDFHQRVSGNPGNAPQNQTTGGPRQTVANTTGRTQLTNARGPGQQQQPPQPPSTVGRPPLSTGMGPNSPSPLSSPNPQQGNGPSLRPLPPLPTTVSNVSGQQSQVTDTTLDTTTTGQQPPKVSEILKSVGKSPPPPESLRNREGLRAQPRVRDITQTTDQTTQGQDHGTGRKV